VAVGDRLDRAMIAGGSVSILAPGMSLAARTFTASRTCHAYIRPEVISEVADEIYGRPIDHIDIVSAIGLPGTTLAHLMLAFNEMLAEPAANAFRGEYIARAIAAQVLTRHAQLIGALPRADSVAPLSRAQLRKVRGFMEGRLHGDFQFAELAAAIGLSRSAFFARFTATMKCTPNQYLQALRVARARSLLEDRRFSITEIATASGFSDQSHMSRFFRRHLGMSPGRYRKTRI
jgi:AraC family transcriptional regulator